MAKIEVSKEEKQGIIDYYTIKIDELENKVSHYKSLIEKLNLDDVIDNLVGENDVEVTVNSASEDVSKVEDATHDKIEKKSIPRQNWKFLALFALKGLNKLSTTPNLYDYIINQKPELSEYEKGDVVSKISTALSNLFTKGSINRVKNNLGRGYFWALPAWYSQGQLIKEYKDELLDEYGVDESSIFGGYEDLM